MEPFIYQHTDELWLVTNGTYKYSFTNYTGWNDKILVRKKTTLQIYFKTFIEKINSGNLTML